MRRRQMKKNCKRLGTFKPSFKSFAKKLYAACSKLTGVPYNRLVRKMGIYPGKKHEFITISLNSPGGCVGDL